MNKPFSVLILILIFVLYSFANNDSIQKNVEPIEKVERTKKVFVFKIHEDIAPPAERKMKKAFEHAEAIDADLIIMNLNTFGGMLDAADKMRAMILELKIPIWVYIDNNAASAGALLAIACDSIYMSPGANIGAATVVNQEGEVMPDKYQSYMRSMMRATAQAKGRDPKIAEAMVDPRIYIAGVNDSNKVLTFTTEEAILNNYCEGMADELEDVLKINQINNYTIIKQELSWLDHVIGFLINPFISGILIMLIIGGIYFELQSPGFGFPIIVAITGAVLYFAPLYLEELAENWEILLFLVGVALIAVEIFVFPGFGVSGIAGILMIVVALTLSLVYNHGFDFSFSGTGALVKSFLVVIISSGLAFVASIWLSQKLLISNQFGELSLKATQNKADGFSSADLSLNNLIGSEGKAHTMLRPVGKIELNNEIYDATCEIGFVEKGDKVKVVKFENQQLVVRKL